MANKGKIVIVAALDGDFQRAEFGKILQLVPLSESVVKLNAVCMSCFNEASFTKRISNEQEVISVMISYILLIIKTILCNYTVDLSFVELVCILQVEIIGGTDKYMSVCRECHRLAKPMRNSPCKIEVPLMEMLSKPKFNVN